MKTSKSKAIVESCEFHQVTPGAPLGIRLVVHVNGPILDSEITLKELESLPELAVTYDEKLTEVIKEIASSVQYQDQMAEWKENWEDYKRQTQLQKRVWKLEKRLTKARKLIKKLQKTINGNSKRFK